MTLHQLEYIVALEEERHFVRAAERCFVTQPTLSMQLQKLENELGVVIFDRKVQPLQPTPIGAKIVAHARKLLRDAQALTALVAAEKGEMKGDYRLGVIPTLAPSLVPRFLSTFMENFPDVRLRIDELQTDQMIAQLESGQLDVGILVGPLAQASLRETKLFQEPFLLYAQQDHSLAQQAEIQAKQLNPAEMWILNQGHCFRNQVLNVCEMRNKPSERHYTYETGSIETLKKMVENGGGYTLVPELAVQASRLKEGIVTRRFATPEPAREVILATHHSYARELFVKNLAASILNSLPADLQTTGEKRTISIQEN